MRRSKFTVNPYGISVKVGCLSCVYKKNIESFNKRQCALRGKRVRPLDVCGSWEMNKCLKEFRIKN